MTLLIWGLIWLVVAILLGLLISTMIKRADIADAQEVAERIKALGVPQDDDELDPRDLRNDTAWTGSTYGV